MDLDVIDIAFALQHPEGLLWVDFEKSNPEEDEPLLRKTFGFHPLAIDDALRETHIPRVDNWGQYLYIVTQAILLTQQDDQIETRELDIFIGENYLVTHHDEPIQAITNLWTSLQRDPRQLREGADYLMYRLLDEMVASYLDIVLRLEDRIDELEEMIFNPSRVDQLENIYTLRRAALRMRRIIDPQREVLDRLAREKYSVIDEQARVYFRDVYDHLVRMYDITDNVHDILTDTLDIHLSLINKRMNDVMKTLTIITTIFMPLSFVVGFFGMNFFAVAEPTPFWTEGNVFVLTMVFLVATPVVMLWWVRRRGWV